MPGVWPVLLQNPTKYVVTTISQAAALTARTGVDPNDEPTSDVISAMPADRARKIRFASAASTASAMPRVHAPAKRSGRARLVACSALRTWDSRLLSPAVAR